MTTLIFLGDKLPTINDPSVCIYSLASVPGIAKRYIYFSWKQFSYIHFLWFFKFNMTAG